MNFKEEQRSLFRCFIVIQITMFINSQNKTIYLYGWVVGVWK